MKVKSTLQSIYTYLKYIFICYYCCNLYSIKLLHWLLATFTKCCSIYNSSLKQLNRHLSRLSYTSFIGSVLHNDNKVKSNLVFKGQIKRKQMHETYFHFFTWLWFMSYFFKGTKAHSVWQHYLFPVLSWPSTSEEIEKLHFTVSLTHVWRPAAMSHNPCIIRQVHLDCTYKTKHL